jgi:hypothetical protein
VILWLIFLPAIIVGIALIVMHGGPIALASAAVIFLFYGSVLVAVTRRWWKARRR